MGDADADVIQSFDQSLKLFIGITIDVIGVECGQTS